MKNAKALEILSNWLQLTYHDVDGTDKDSAELYEALYTVSKLISYDKSKIERLKKKIGKLEKIQEKLQSTLLKQEDTMQIIAEEKQEYFDKLQTAKTEAYKECLAKVKNYIKTHCNPYGKPDFDYDTSIRILNFIDNILKEMTEVNENDDTKNNISASNGNRGIR